MQVLLKRHPWHTCSSIGCTNITDQDCIRASTNGTQRPRISLHCDAASRCRPSESGPFRRTRSTPALSEKMPLVCGPTVVSAAQQTSTVRGTGRVPASCRASTCQFRVQGLRSAGTLDCNAELLLRWAVGWPAFRVGSLQWACAGPRSFAVLTC
jgi:hypothetical protein